MLQTLSVLTAMVSKVGETRLGIVRVCSASLNGARFPGASAASHILEPDIRSVP